MVENRNNLFRKNPNKFLKSHLVVRTSKDGNSPFLIRDELFRVEFQKLVNFRDDYEMGMTNKFMGRLKYVVPIIAVLSNQNVDMKTDIIGQYIPYSSRTAYFRTIRAGVHCIFTHPFTGCDYLVSDKSNATKKMMHIPSVLRPELRAQKITECFGADRYHEITSDIYSPSEVLETTQIIGIASRRNQRNLIVQNFVDTASNNLPKAQQAAEKGAKYYATNIYKKLDL